jgi:methyl-accepting chemotaxis protein
VLYLYGTRTITTAFVHSKLRVMSTAEFLLPALAICTLAVAGAVALVAAIRLLWLSHQIAGPLYRLERTAQAIGNGDLSGEVRLRVGDELQDFARSMGGMVSDLRARVREAQAQTRQLRDVIAQARRRPDAPPELLDALQESGHRLDEVLNRFRV